MYGKTNLKKTIYSCNDENFWVKPSLEEGDDGWIITEGKFLMKGKYAVQILQKLEINLNQVNLLVKSARDDKENGEVNDCVKINKKGEMSLARFPNWRQIIPAQETKKYEFVSRAKLMFKGDVDKIDMVMFLREDFTLTFVSYEFYEMLAYLDLSIGQFSQGQGGTVREGNTTPIIVGVPDNDFILMMPCRKIINEEILDEIKFLGKVVEKMEDKDAN